MNTLNKLILITLLFLALPSFAADVVTVDHSADGWRLLVDGDPYLIRGMCYDPSAIGKSPDPHNNSLEDWSTVDKNRDGINDLAYQTWIDENKNNIRDADEKDKGDFTLLKDMGVNTLRIYHHLSDNAELVALNSTHPWYNTAPNKELYRELYDNFGIMLMMGDLLGAYSVSTGASAEEGTDYTDEKQKAHMLKSVEVMANDFKDEPYILLWSLGNENEHDNSNTNALEYPEEYLHFVNEAAKKIKQIDRNKHPVALILQDISHFTEYAHLIPDVDIIANNNYRPYGLGNLWTDAATHYDKPVLISEYGNHNKVPEKVQSSMHKSLWLDIQHHAASAQAPQNAIGGFPFTFTDVWWLSGNPWLHEKEGEWNFEWSGMTSLGEGRSAADNSPLLRQLRPVYYQYQQLWATSNTPNNGNSGQLPVND